MADKNKNLIYSLIIGEASSWFLIFIIKNPYLEEARQFLFLEKIIWWLPVVFPFLFLLGVLAGNFLSRIKKIFLQLARFGEVGVLNTLIDFGILNLLIWQTGITGGWAIAPLNAASFLCATTNSYFWNKFWTFEESRKASGRQFSKFLVVSGIGIGINTGIMVAGTVLFSPMFGISPAGWANIMKILATLVSMVWNFLGYKFVVFKDEKQVGPLGGIEKKL
jgi:putative flippase GtrA